MNKIHILGMGPGHPDYVLPVTRRLIGQCGVLVDLLARERLAHRVAVSTKLTLSLPLHFYKTVLGGRLRWF